MAYLHEDREQFIQALGLAHKRTKQMVQIIEKDYYVTMLLRLLAQKMPFIVFKGGTSLSKCYKVIRRFSEDIDLTIDMPLSQGQKKKVKYAIVDFAEELGMKIENLDDTKSRRDYNRYVISYDSVLPIPSTAIKSAVLLETSYVSVSFPTVMLPVYSYLGDMMRYEAPEYVDEFRLAPFEMKVQGMERTLVDKVFAVCDYYLSGKTIRHSRHLYDIYKLLPLVSLDDSFRSLVQEVRKVRSGSPICLSALPEANLCGLLKEIIDKEVYKKDYEDLTMQLLEEKVPYDIAIESLKKLVANQIF